MLKSYSQIMRKSFNDPAPKWNKPSFFLVFILTLIVLLLGSRLTLDAFYAAEVKSLNDKLAIEESGQAKILAEYSKTNYNNILSIVNLGATMPGMVDLANAPTPDKLRRAQQNMLAFMNMSDTFDRIVYIDKTGQEIIRIDDLDGKATLTASVELANRVNDPLFLKSMLIEKGHSFVSRINMATTGAAVVRPYAPTIIIASPVFTSTGKKAGVIAFYVLMKPYFDTMNSLGESPYHDSNFMILDENGFFIYNEGDHNFEWGSFLPDRAKFNLPSQHPDAWAQIRVQRIGQVFTPDGLFTFRAFDETPIIRTSNNALLKVTPEETPLFYTVFYLPRAEMNQMASPLLGEEQLLLWYMDIGAFFVSLSIAFLATWYRMRREIALYEATHDMLTNLPNRKFFSDNLDKVCNNPANTGQPVVVFYLDLDGFKVVNDTYGHDAGDAVLVEAGKRVKAHLRASDLFARIGGDEFAVLVQNKMSRTTLDEISQRIVAAVNAPIEYAGHSLLVSASLGIVARNTAPEIGKTILKEADSEMYKAKQAGKNRVSLAWHTD